MIRPALFLPLFIACMLFAAAPAMAQSRNAAFLDPASSAGAGGAGAKGGGPNTVVADPAQTDAGETLVNVARRVTVFFYNGFRSVVQLNELTINADGNVRSKVLSDDCKAIKALPPQARCSVVMEIVPGSPGPWSVELLLNHSGQGRIARAELVGTTLGKTDEKSEGLAVSKKIAAPIDFGAVHAGEESAARTMLIENDSTEPLKISSIDLISHDKQELRLRDSGCQKGDELKPGESCPITIIWEPQYRGSVVTDLIVHHSGNLGFVVVPIRGSADSAEGKDGDGKIASSGKTRHISSEPSIIPRGMAEQRGVMPSMINPPSMEQIANSLPAIDSGKLKQTPAKNAEAPKPDLPALSLIGTVNGRAILGTPDGQNYVLGLGESTAITDLPVSLLQLDSTRAVVNIAGTRKELHLRQAPTFMRAKKQEPDLGGTGSSSSSSGSSGVTGGAAGASSSFLPAAPSATGPGNSTPSGTTMGLDTPPPAALPKS